MIEKIFRTIDGWSDRKRFIWIVLYMLQLPTVLVVAREVNAPPLAGLRVSRIYGEGRGVPIKHPTAELLAYEMAEMGAWSEGRIFLSQNDKWQEDKSSTEGYRAQWTGASIRGNEESPKLNYNARCSPSHCEVWLSYMSVFSVGLAEPEDFRPRWPSSGGTPQPLSPPPVKKDALLQLAINRSVEDFVTEWQRFQKHN